jgi:hypothetical protein
VFLPDDHIRFKRIHFYRLGLGGSNQVNSKGWKLETFNTIINRLGHANVSNIVMVYTRIIIIY